MGNEKSMKIRKYIMVIVTVIFFVYQMYLALVKQLTPMLQGPLHLVLALTLAYLYNPADKKYRKKVTKAAEAKGEKVDPAVLNKRAWMNWLDVFIYVGLAYMLWYVISRYEYLSTQFVMNISPVETIDNVMMVVTIVLLLIAVYRTLGAVLAGFILLFIVYAWTAPYLPGILYTRGKSFTSFLKQFTTGMVMTQSGVFGTPLYTSASTLFYFIVFGAFFSAFGGGQLLIDVGMKFSNKSSGAPAKAAVISSGLMGMISGSAVANVATTGVMTIPMMKKIGYEPEEAGAVEAVASTGGQIMPPIMGVGAFIMAEMLGIQYSKVAAAAIIPAVAYYFAVFVLVDRVAAKHANDFNKGVDASIKVKRPVLSRLYLLLPAIVLVVYIVRGASLMRAGMMGIFFCLICDVVSLILYVKKKGSFNLMDIVSSDKKVEDHDFVDLKGIWSCCMDGAKQAAEIAIPTAACGIIINVVTGQTSLATNLAGVISGLGTSNLMLAMLIAMVGCMLLGMALPTVAAYLVGVILFVPCIRPLLTPEIAAAYSDPNTVNLCANMFVFYFGIMAQITPPVCVASYTAAGIADGNAMKTGLKGFFFALTGFLVPFVFIYNPAILLQGSVTEIALGTAMLLAGCFFLAVTVSGFFGAKMNNVERIILLVAAFCLISPEIITSIIGIILGIVLLVLNTARGKKAAAA